MQTYTYTAHTECLISSKSALYNPGHPLIPKIHFRFHKKVYHAYGIGNGCKTTTKHFYFYQSMAKQTVYKWRTCNTTLTTLGMVIQRKSPQQQDIQYIHSIIKKLGITAIDLYAIFTFFFLRWVFMRQL